MRKSRRIRLNDQLFEDEEMKSVDGKSKPAASRNLIQLSHTFGARTIIGSRNEKGTNPSHTVIGKRNLFINSV